MKDRPMKTDEPENNPLHNATAAPAQTADSNLFVNASTTVVDHQPPAHLKDRIAADKAGRGISDDPTDSVYPLLTVLQSNSPVCNLRSPDHVQGAEAGHFFARTLPSPVINGVKGFEAIPVLTNSAWREWKPNRGGFVCTHFVKPTGLRAEDNGSGLQVVLPNGNVLITTKQVFLLLNGLPFELPCTSTAISRFYNKLVSHFKYLTDDGGNRYACYAHRYRFRTTELSNREGTWFGITFEDLGWVSETEYDMAQKASITISEWIESQKRHGRDGSSSPLPLPPPTSQPASESATGLF
jgi:hypothetical protein